MGLAIFLGEALTDTFYLLQYDTGKRKSIWATLMFGGGSSPSTSFDCSGFVSWVINHCGNGWSVGRQTASGLENLCDTHPLWKQNQRFDFLPKGNLCNNQRFHVEGDLCGAIRMMIHTGDVHCGSSVK